MTEAPPKSEPAKTAGADAKPASGTPQAEQSGPSSQPGADQRAAREAHAAAADTESLRSEQLDLEDLDDPLLHFAAASGSIRVGSLRNKGGQAAVGHHATNIGVQVNHMGRPTEDASWSTPIPAHLVAQLVMSYTATGSDEDLIDHLKTQDLVYLTGDSGTGRQTAAMVALEQQAGAQCIATVRLAANIRLVDVVRRVELLGNHGHVLDISTTPHPDLITLAVLEDQARRQQAKIVVIGQRAQAGVDLGHYPVHHRPAKPEAIFRKQLAYWLEQHARCVGTCADCCHECVPPYVEVCLGHANLANHLHRIPPVAEIADIAKRIAETAPTAEALADLLAQLMPDPYRNEARKILRITPDEQKSATPALTPEYRRAFRIAYAVFEGEPLARVFSAAELLAPSPESTTQPATVQRHLGIEVSSLLPPGMSPDTATTEGGGGSPQVARLRDRELVFAILDVAWNEWGLSGRLLDWLKRLVNEGSPAERRRAAVVAGWLAWFDFAQVYDTLVDAWAANAKRDLRSAAALTLVSTAGDKRFADAVGLRMRNWALGPSAFRGDSVAQAYALGIGRSLDRRGLTDLEMVAMDRRQRLNEVIAQAVAQLYEPAEARATMRELFQWSRSGNEWLQLHAARSLVLLASRSARERGRQCPDLMLRIHHGHVEPSDAAGLWALALSHPGTAFNAWQLLTYWLSRAEAYPELNDTMLGLLERLGQEPPLRTRLVHQYRHVWREQRPDNALLDRVGTMLEEN